ncbi:MAG TPA: hypothetical protein VEO54_03175 [Thermoanaerobaculia bacterium]|nr:hypothetical protein [Thermoanaerobaculia bacterium]
MKTKIAFLLFAVTAFALPSFAQFYPRQIARETPEEGWSGETTYEQGQYLDNPCTAIQDWVWVNYSAYASGTQEQAGVNRFLFNENTSMGGMYAASGASDADIAYGSPVSTRHYHKVNTSDNFHVVTVINFNPATQAMTLALETACGNGMPDSAQ